MNQDTPTQLVPSPPLNSVDPIIITSNDNFSFGDHSKPRFRFSIMLIIILILVITLLTGVVGSIAIAYEKISINNSELENKVSKFILSFPFSPKTPKFLIGSITKSHSLITAESFNVSMSAKSDDLAAKFGLNQFDIEVKGDGDWSDKKNFLSQINFSLTKDLDVDLKTKDNIVYFKINKIPPAVYLYLESYSGISKESLEPLLQNWISYDISPLQTNARKLLDDRSSNDLPQQKLIDFYSNVLLDKKILDNIKITNDSSATFKTYKMHFAPDSQTLDYLGKNIENNLKFDGAGKQSGRIISENPTKLSDTIKDLAIDIWVDESKYYLRKIETTFKIKPILPSIPTLNTLPSNVLGLATHDAGISAGLKSDIAIAIVIEFSNFGKKFDIQAPENSITVEEFYKLLSEQLNTINSKQSTVKPKVTY